MTKDFATLPTEARDGQCVSYYHNTLEEMSDCRFIISCSLVISEIL